MIESAASGQADRARFLHQVHQFAAGYAQDRFPAVTFQKLQANRTEIKISRPLEVGNCQRDGTKLGVRR